MRSVILGAMLLLNAVLASIGARAANSVTVSPLVGDAGGVVEVSVVLDNTDAAYAMQLLIDLPEGGGCEVVEALATGRAEGFDASAGIRDGRLSLMLYSLDRKVIAAGNGDVALFRVRLDNRPIEATLAAEAIITDAEGNGMDCPVEPVQFRSLRPLMSIAEKSVDYGRVPLTDKAQRVINIHNSGTAELTVSDVTFDRTEFAVVSALPVSVAPGASTALTVEFTPAERGKLSGMARIISNSEDTYNGVDLTALPYAVNELTIGSASGVCDEEVTLPLSLSNMDAVNGISMEIQLPKQLEYVADSFVLNEERADGHAFSAVCSDEGLLKIMVYSLTNNPFRGNSGEIASLRLRLNGKYSYTVEASKAVLSVFYRGEIIDVLSDCYSGNVSIRYPSLSLNSELSLGRTAIPAAATERLRINNYGNAPLTVSRMEMDNTLLNIDTQFPLTVEPYGQAYVEISCEGETTGNIDGVLSIYSNDPDKRLATVRVSAERYAENCLTFVGKEALLTAGQAQVEVSLDNYTPIKGMQFDITYPADQLTPVDDAVMAGRAEEFQVTRRDIAPGVSRYFIYSLAGATIEPGSGLVVKIPYDMLEGCAAGEHGLTASEFVLSSPELENMNSRLTPMDFNITLYEAPMSIRLSESAVMLKPGDAITLTAEYEPASAVDLPLTWTTSNADVAAVDGEGNVTALAVGKAVITAALAENPEVAATCEITVDVADSVTDPMAEGADGETRFYDLNGCRIDADALTPGRIVIVKTASGAAKVRLTK